MCSERCRTFLVDGTVDLCPRLTSPAKELPQGEVLPIEAVPSSICEGLDAIVVERVVVPPVATGTFLDFVLVVLGVVATIVEGRCVAH